MNKTAKLFHTPINQIYGNLGHYSLLTGISQEEYNRVKNRVENIAQRIREGEPVNIDKEDDELYNKLTEINRMNEYINYTLTKKDTPENIQFMWNVFQSTIGLMDLVVLRYVENNLKPQYDILYNELHEVLIRKEEYFMKNILRKNMN